MIIGISIVFIIGYIVITLLSGDFHPTSALIKEYIGEVSLTKLAFVMDKQIGNITILHWQWVCFLH